MTKANAALATLLARAEGADPANRIDLRDPIAAHGAVAIEAVTPWLKDPALAAFARSRRSSSRPWLIRSGSRSSNTSGTGR